MKSSLILLALCTTVSRADSIDSLTLLSRFGHIPFANLLLGLFGGICGLLCFRIWNVYKRASLDSSVHVQLPVNGMLLLASVLRAGTLLYESHPDWFNSISSRVLVELVLIFSTLPIILLCIVSGLSVISWMQVYRVTIRQDKLESDFYATRLNFLIVACIIFAIVLSIRGYLANVPNYGVPLNLYVWLSIIVAGLCSVMAIAFGITGSIIAKNISSFQRKIVASSTGIQIRVSFKLEAALNTQLAGIMFCVCCAAASSLWIFHTVLYRFVLPNSREVRRASLSEKGEMANQPSISNTTGQNFQRSPSDIPTVTRSNSLSGPSSRITSGELNLTPIPTSNP
jgi:hypothetical protein